MDVYTTFKTQGFSHCTLFHAISINVVEHWGRGEEDILPYLCVYEIISPPKNIHFYPCMQFIKFHSFLTSKFK